MQKQHQDVLDISIPSPINANFFYLFIYLFPVSGLSTVGFHVQSGKKQVAKNVLYEPTCIGIQ